ncbi:MAG: Panacea domain-containing protein [Pyrinomonadaceae bacterium]
MSENELKLSVLPVRESDNVTVSGADVPNVELAVSASASTKGAELLVDPATYRAIQIKPAEKTTEISVHDVATFILDQRGEMTAMKLQKLVYYCQAWSLVWDEAPLFDEPIEAWANGPVVRALYLRHQGQFNVSKWQGDPSKLSDVQKETILRVLEFYGDLPSQVLSNLTHQEAPWLDARQGLSATDRGQRVIEHAAMAEYYSSL